MKAAVALLSTMIVAGGDAEVAYPARTSSVPAEDLKRATVSFDALMTHYYDRRSGIFYRADHAGGSGGVAASLWELAHLLDSARSMARLRHVPPAHDAPVTAVLDLLSRYRAKGPYHGYTATLPLPGPAPEQFRDDNEWLGLDFVRMYRYGRPTAFDEARRLFAWIVTGWDRNRTHACNGGVFWQVGGAGDRNAVSNAPRAELGYRLYLLTGEGFYLHWANRMYDWTRRCLKSGRDLYFDHINLAGGLDRRMFTYVQGVMIGASVLRDCMEGHGFIVAAQSLAAASMAYFTLTRLANEPPEFVDLYATDLISLESVDHDPAIRAYLQAYADGVWAHAYHRASSLFEFYHSRPAQLDQQAAMVNIYALLASPTPPPCQ